MISIEGLDKSLVLMALWKHSKAQGMSFMGLPPEPPDVSTFQRVVDYTPDLNFEYVLGHVIKCNLSKDEFDPTWYDRDLGAGAAENAILEEFTRPD